MKYEVISANEWVYPDSTVEFPQEMIVDYVHVHQKTK